MPAARAKFRAIFPDKFPGRNFRTNFPEELSKGIFLGKVPFGNPRGPPARTPSGTAGGRSVLNEREHNFRRYEIHRHNVMNFVYGHLERLRSKFDLRIFGAFPAGTRGVRAKARTGPPRLALRDGPGPSAGSVPGVPGNLFRVGGPAPWPLPVPCA